MKKLYTICLSLGLLLSITTTYTYEEESVGNEIQKDLEKQTSIETQKTKKKIDLYLYDLFENFFDENDTEPFSKFVNKAIEILKTYSTILKNEELESCTELIHNFETNKHNSNPVFWAKILSSPTLINLLSQETQNYLPKISNVVKIKSLIYKLRNNRN